MRVNSKRKFWCGSGLIVLMAGTAMPARADESVSAKSGDQGIPEITVTAQKRKQSGQDVDIALTVVSGNALAMRGVSAPSELASLVPNLQANYGFGETAFNVRGIGVNQFSANLDSPVAINLDEVYLSKNFMSGLLMFDIDRVEVLKGPQGTLFGRNATGGTVNFFTRRPSDHLEAGGNVSYDNYETVRTEAYISGPLTQTISARLSGMLVDQGKGTYYDATLAMREGQEKKWALRGQLKWASGPDQALLTVSGGAENGTLSPYQGVGVFTPASVAAGKPVYCANYLAGHAVVGDASCVRGTDGGYPQSSNPYIAYNNRLHTVHNRSISATLRYEHDFETATLTSLAAYQSFTRRQHEDSDGSPVDTLDVDYNNRIHQFNEELRLTSKGDRTWNYVLGAYYEHDGYTNGDYLEVGYGSVGYYSPFVQKTDALAVFFHNDVKLNDQLSLVAGLRYSWERVSFDGGTYLASGISAPPVAPTTILGTLASANTHQAADDPTFKVGVEWRPQVSGGVFDKLMVYGHVSTGFRSGGYSDEFATAQAQLTTLSPEKITAYEIGFKSTLFDRRMQLNGGLFHYAFVNGFINVDSATSPVPITINAASVNSWGAELDWQWRPVRDVSLGMTAGWLSSHINDAITAAGQNLQGNSTVQSPRWTYNANFNYTPEIGNGLRLTVGADANWRSSQYYNAENTPASLEPGYWLADAHAGIGGTNQLWTVTAFIKNIGNRVYRTYVNDLPSFGWVLNIYGQPRTFGAALNVRF